MPRIISNITNDQESFVKQDLRYDPSIYPVKSAIDAIPPGGVPEDDYVRARETAIDLYLANNQTGKKLKDLIGLSKLQVVLK